MSDQVHLCQYSYDLVRVGIVNFLRVYCSKYPDE